MVQLQTGSQSRTPKSHPIFGVHFSEEKIRAIAHCAFPESELLAYEQLPRGQSFNNRIYFLRLRHAPSLGAAKSGPVAEEEEFVLKVNGRYFGADKIQNEVGCVWLLERHCPQVPSPRVFAWSEDGENIFSLSRDRESCQMTSPPLSEDSADAKAGWILMSRVKGQPLSTLDLDEEEWASIGAQVADFVHDWRQGIPVQARCGCVYFTKDPDGEANLGASPDQDRPVPGLSGIVGDGLQFTKPVTSALDFQTVKIHDKINQLKTSDTYLRNRPLVTPLHNFVTNVLLRLKLITNPTANGNDGFVFTHYDLSPRNILVSKVGSSHQITGLIDFEFSGFFPALEEFVNDYVDNGGDWPKVAYNAYLRRLGELGIPTPENGIETEVWEQAHELGHVLENIAPWWLPGELDDKELEEALETARKKVTEGIKKLEDTVM